MEFIIVSDNHGKAKILKKIVEKYPNADAYIHCGDSEMDPRDLLPFEGVTGNNDYYFRYPESLVVERDSIRILVMHSHTLPFGRSVESLVSKAKQLNCQIACYGHTHRYDHRMIDDVLVINPSSLHYNRDGSRTGFVRLTVDDKGYQVERIFAEDIEKTL